MGDEAPHHGKQVVDCLIFAKTFQQGVFARLIVDEAHQQFRETFPEEGQGDHLGDDLQEVDVGLSAAESLDDARRDSAIGEDHHIAKAYHHAPTVDIATGFGWRPLGHKVCVGLEDLLTHLKEGIGVDARAWGIWIERNDPWFDLLQDGNQSCDASTKSWVQNLCTIDVL